MKETLTIITILFISLAGKNSGQTRLDNRFPEIDGYIPLCCDFHMHTLYSDGLVWPTVRIDEAVQEDIDAIAITEHIEKAFRLLNLSSDLNESYLKAKKEAADKGVILIRGGEITRDMPPGHHNAIFLSDVNQLEQESYTEAFCEAKKQKAFVFWNHPGWKRQQPDTVKWFKEHDFLYENGFMQGIEVVNEGHYSPEAHRWCLEKNLTMLANSDLHTSSGMRWDFSKGEHRPLTIVYASGRSEEAIKEGLLAGRTLLWHNDTLIGEETLLEKFFKNSVNVRHSKIQKDNMLIVTLENHSSMLYRLKINQKIQADDPYIDLHYTLLPGGEVKIPLIINSEDHDAILKLSVVNLIPEPGKVLNVDIDVPEIEWASLKP